MIRLRLLLSRFGILAVLLLVIAGTSAWTSLALWIDAGYSSTVRGVLIAAYLLLSLFVLLRIRPFYRAVLAYAVLFVLVLIWWLNLEPQNDRDWSPEYVRLPRAELHGDMVTIHNLRDFDYTSAADSIPQWETRTYDLSKLQG